MPFIVPVLPPAEDAIEDNGNEEDESQEECDRINELTRICALFDECGIEDQELILEGDPEVEEATVYVFGFPLKKKVCVAIQSF